MTKNKKQPPSRRVVITGLGVISSIGIGWQTFWENLLAGKAGIRKISLFDTSAYDRHYAGEVSGFEPEKFIRKNKLKFLPRASKFAIAASKLAVKDAGLTLAELKNLKMGVCVGTTMGEIQVAEQFVKHSIKKTQSITYAKRILYYPYNVIPINVAHELKLAGHNLLFGNACAAGNYSIGYALDLISSGRADYILAGGSDALSRVAFTGFGRMFAMAERRCQPFDKDRQGMMLGEGSGMLVLESLESAQKRKAKVYAEVLGYGLSCNAQHMTIPSTNGASNAIEKAIKNAGIQKSKVDYISAHGTATKENDGVESEAFNRVFGNDMKNIPVSSIKSMLGHTMGAASALEAIACCLAIQDNKIPPTINLENQDPECKIDCVPNKSREKEVSLVLNNAQAFGGNNACVVFREV
ncbi:MAG: beta-ketoacyl-[acyl-carrier-protein] synthase family protein [Candidatus Omnitrophica bacterium]|nr:beta-ketoacyl-[acyl-carrier-protein] synthase family protein [Candidatus Omnitrophota bacterium]